MIHPRVRAAVSVLLGAVVLVGCSSAASSDTTTAASIRVLEPAAAAELLDDEDPVVIDVRTPEEFAQGHLEDARLIDYNAPDFRDRIAELDRDATYLIYCRSGNRSAGARQVMEELGFTDVSDVEGGIVAWADAGLPVTTG